MVGQQWNIITILCCLIWGINKQVANQFTETNIKANKLPSSKGGVKQDLHMPFTLAEQKCSLVFTKSKHITSRRIMLLMAAISICLDINNPFGCLFLCQQFSIPWEKNVFWILQVNKVKDISNLSALYYCPSQNTSEARNGRTQLLGVLRYCRAWLCRLSFGVHFLWLPRKVCSSRKRGMEIKEDDRRPS